MSVITEAYPVIGDEPWNPNEPFNLFREGRSGTSCTPVNTLTNVQVTSARSDFPVEYALNAHPNQVCRAESGVTSVIYTGTLAKGTDTLFLFNTNAESIKIFTTDFAFGEWRNDSWRGGDAWREHISNGIPFEVVDSGRNKAVGLRFPPLLTSKKLMIKMSTPTGLDVELGILWAGPSISSHNFIFGLQGSHKDYGIFEELSNGADYYSPRNIVKTFAGSILDDPKFIRTIFNEVSGKKGKLPIPWFITDLECEDWLVFARLTNSATTSYDYDNLHNLQLSIIEVI